MMHLPIGCYEPRKTCKGISISSGEVEMNHIPVNCHMHSQSYLILWACLPAFDLFRSEEKFAFMINNFIPYTCLGDICVYTLGLASCAPLIDVILNALNTQDVTKVASPLFFPYFSRHFSCLKCLLCYHVARHVIPPSLSATCATIVTHLRDCQSHCRP